MGKNGNLEALKKTLNEYIYVRNTIQNRKNYANIDYIKNIKNGNMYFIEFSIIGYLDAYFNSARDIAKFLDKDVLFYFNGVDIIINSKTIYRDMFKQYVDKDIKNSVFRINSKFEERINEINFDDLNKINDYLYWNIEDVNDSSLSRHNKSILTEKLINKYYEASDKSGYVKTRLMPMTYHTHN